MQNKRLFASVVSVCLALVLQGEVFAKGFSYTYVEAGYQGLRADSIDADGVNFDLSFGATDHIMVLLGYSHLIQDSALGLSSVDVDIDEFRMGGGGHFSFGKRFDLVGSVVYVTKKSSGEARFPGDTSKSRVSGSDDGYEVEISGRIQALKKLEVTPRVIYRDVGSFSEVGGGLDVIYKFYKKWSVLGNATYFSEDSTKNFFLGVRLDM